MMRVRVDCKHCRKDAEFIPADGKEIIRYYCALNRMENGSCPEDCEWYTPDKSLVV